MSLNTLTQLSDSTLLSSADALAVRIETATAEFLAHLAVIDDRKLYARDGYPSMFAFCLARWRMSEDAVGRRIHAARVARRFPAIFPALAEGRLHLSAVILLAPYLDEAHADDLIAAATHKTRAQIESMLAVRFPQPDLPTRMRALPQASVRTSSREHAPERVENEVQVTAGTSCDQGDCASNATEGAGLFAANAIHEQAESRALGGAVGRDDHALVPATLSPTKRPRLTPLAPERFGLQVTIDRRTHDKLRHAQNLLSHAVSPSDIAQVLDRALDALIAQLERRKFAATSRPWSGFASSRRPRNPRTIPAYVKRAVWDRDGGQCTFVSEAGHRCEARSLLEFDHMDEVVRGGQASISRIRLRCRAHNQLAAEDTFGREFMDRKRSEAAGERAAHGERVAQGERAAARVGASAHTATPNSRSA